MAGGALGGGLGHPEGESYRRSRAFEGTQGVVKGGFLCPRGTLGGPEVLGVLLFSPWGGSQAIRWGSVFTLRGSEDVGGASHGGLWHLGGPKGS